MVGDHISSSSWIFILDSKNNFILSTLKKQFSRSVVTRKKWVYFLLFVLWDMCGNLWIVVFENLIEIFYALQKKIGIIKNKNIFIFYHSLIFQLEEKSFWHNYDSNYGKQIQLFNF